MYHSKDKDDMQDQTFNLIYQWLAICTETFMDKDAEKLLNAIWAIYGLVHPRMKKELSEDFRNALESAEEKIYGHQGNISPDYGTKIFEEVRNIYFVLTKFLHDQGLSLTAKVDYNTLITQRSDS